MLFNLQKEILIFVSFFCFSNFEKNKDGPHVVTRNPSFLIDKGQLDKKVKSGQLEEHTEATQSDLQTQIPSKGPGLKIKLCQLDSE